MTEAPRGQGRIPIGFYPPLARDIGILELVRFVGDRAVVLAHGPRPCGQSDGYLVVGRPNPRLLLAGA